MVEPFQVLDLTVDLLSVSGVRKRILYFLESTYSGALFKFSFPDLPIRSLSHLLYHLKTLRNLLVHRCAKVSLHAPMTQMINYIDQQTP